MKCKTLPPRKLYHPVLPYRSGEKLLFPLCRRCADAQYQGRCHCTVEERSIVGTWCTPELETAIQKGYRILTVYEVYHWAETTRYDPETGEGGLFAKYVNTFLKFKQESSGWPKWVKTDDDREKYISDYFEHEGIQLNAEFIKQNKGLRALAKLCLNSFWGKFGQRINMPKNVLVTDVSEFYAILTNPARKVIDWHIMNENCALVTWECRADFLPEHTTTNIFIAAFTTAHARLKLYDVLDKLKRRVLYFDTDSIVYLSEPGLYDPELGDYLGDLTDELKGENIVEFVSCGPKNYAYLLSDGSACCKVKGFRLDYTTMSKINFNTMCDQLFLWHFDMGYTAIKVDNPRKICRDKLTAKIYNRK